MTDMPSDQDEGRGWYDETWPDQGEIVVRRYGRRGGVSLKNDVGALSSLLNCISFSRKNFLTYMLIPALALKPTSHREVR